ncbi:MULTISPECIES: VOC family protein [unclassified Oceanobacter]|jgi:predicted enzyme related to lactoylglutathione lyase|uniref:VOC family protein n=1 Tax=unclassified Oceanobacter TaxID=2620260 RepID=UPI0026E20EB0|nr:MULTISPECIES: VOC family protein [unclassified Oceanobacter]MDO6682285.1 VOC family protein [Oceanobacter sp. 5_MG-2023]MDP2506281.1 VOC family protein [Oceanobacter sp. 3_MG-2023]
MNQHGKLNYVEMAASNLEATKAFFNAAFGWQFIDYGPDYTAFADAGLDGGFYRAELASRVEQGGALLVFFSNHLEETLAAVEQAGGVIIQPIFAFPGGRRFHFTEPSGNELAVWSE